MQRERERKKERGRERTNDKENEETGKKCLILNKEIFKTFLQKKIPVCFSEHFLLLLVSAFYFS